MTEIFQEAVKGYNLPLTSLLGLIAVYWVIAMFGLIDHDTIDGVMGFDGIDGADGHDIGGGHDGDLGDTGDVADAGDGDMHGDADSSSGNAFHAVMQFLGVGDAPFTFVMSVFVLFLWCGNIAANLYLNDAESTSRANLLLVGVAVSAFVLTKLTIRPLRPLMKMMRNNEVHKPLTGQSGTVRSAQLTADYGQIEVIEKGASLLINARLSEGCDPVPRGTEVLIVAKDDTRDLHIARPISNETSNQST